MAMGESTNYRKQLMVKEQDLHFSQVEEFIGEKPLYIWGAGAEAKELRHYVKRVLGRDIECFVDWMGRSVGSKIDGIPVESPVFVRKECEPGKCFIFLATRAWRNAGCVLINMGFDHLKDFLVPYCGFSQESSFYRGETLNNLLFVGQQTSSFRFLNEGLVYYRLDGTPIRKIGAYCSIAMGAAIVQNHPTYASTSSFFFRDDQSLFESHFGACNGLTEVGNDVWLGRDAIIMPGVKIGNGAIVGSSSVVSQDVPDYAVVMGNPARIVSFRFDPDKISLLNTAQWWNWSPGKIENYKHLFQSDDLSAFFLELDKMVASGDYF